LSFDIWTYAAPITVGSHTLKVFGTALSGSYSGSLSLTGTPVSVPTITASVPEPESYAMLLAGLGLMGAIAKRRKAKQA
jgi:hypothetical protein